MPQHTELQNAAPRVDYASCCDLVTQIACTRSQLYVVALPAGSGALGDLAERTRVLIAQFISQLPFKVALP